MPVVEILKLRNNGTVVGNLLLRVKEQTLAIIVPTTGRQQAQNSSGVSKA